MLAAFDLVGETMIPDQLQMHALAKQAHLSIGALYIYFKSKEELLAGMLHEELRQVPRGRSDLAYKVACRYLPMEHQKVVAVEHFPEGAFTP